MVSDEKKPQLGGCGDCVCRACLMYWSQRCPMGGCWDDERALVEQQYGQRYGLRIWTARPSDALRESTPWAP